VVAVSLKKKKDKKGIQQRGKQKKQREVDIKNMLIDINAAT